MARATAKGTIKKFADDSCLLLFVFCLDFQKFLFSMKRAQGRRFRELFRELETLRLASSDITFGLPVGLFLTSGSSCKNWC